MVIDISTVKGPVVIQKTVTRRSGLSGHGILQIALMRMGIMKLPFFIGFQCFVVSVDLFQCGRTLDCTSLPVRRSKAKVVQSDLHEPLNEFHERMDKEDGRIPSGAKASHLVA